MNNLVFGKYLPLDSLIHKVDPRSKIIALILMLVSIFLTKSWIVYGVIAFVCILAVIISKVGFKSIIKTFKPMILMMVFLFVVNCLSVKTGDLWLSFWKIEIYEDAVMNTLLVIVRLFLMINVTTILTATTKPLDLTLGLEILLKPLNVVKFPVHEMAMMISIALRFIPTIIEETIRIMNAQKSRGVDFEEGKLKEKVTAILSLIVPLFSVAFQRAYELADAMEARGYIPDAYRTRYRELKFKIIDLIYLLIVNAVLAFSIYMAVIS